MRVAGILLAAATLVGACGGSTAGNVDAFGLPVGQPITRGELLAHDESHLFYPGSTLLREIGSNQTPNPNGEEPNPAYAGAILTASVTAGGLYAFYGRELRARGFHMVNDYRLSSQVSGEAWEVDQRVQVQVGIFDPRRLEADQGIVADVGPGRLAYEEVLVGYARHPAGDLGA